MWIESHQSLANHPKLKRFAREMSISKQEAIGYLHMLWWWALEYAPKGELIPLYNTDDIADAMEYEGNPDELVRCLIKSGFLDKDNDNKVTVHDWYDYAGKLLKKREIDRERKRIAREVIKRHE